MQRTEGPSRAQSSSLTQSSAIPGPAGEWVSLCGKEQDSALFREDGRGEAAVGRWGGRGTLPPLRSTLCMRASVQGGGPEILLYLIILSVPLLLSPRAGWGARAQELKELGFGDFGLSLAGGEAPAPASHLFPPLPFPPFVLSQRDKTPNCTLVGAQPLDLWSSNLNAPKRILKNHLCMPHVPFKLLLYKIYTYILYKISNEISNSCIWCHFQNIVNIGIKKKYITPVVMNFKYQSNLIHHSNERLNSQFYMVPSSSWIYVFILVTLPNFILLYYIFVHESLLLATLS